MKAHTYYKVRAEARYIERKDLDKDKGGKAYNTTIARRGLESEIGSWSASITEYTTTSRMNNIIEVEYSQAIRRPLEGGSDDALSYAHGGHRPKRIARVSLGTKYRGALPLRRGRVDSTLRRVIL